MRTGVVVCLLTAFAASLTAESGSSNRQGRSLERGWQRDTRPVVHRPGESSSDDVLGQLREVQARTLSLSRKAEFVGDFQAALAAAALARANAELMTELRARTAATGNASTNSPIFAVAFTDGTIRAVRAYWTTDDVLNLVSLEGKLEHARNEQVDWKRTQQLNGR